MMTPIAASDDIAVSIRNLKKSFGDKIVLDGVNLDIHRGESMVVIGASGTGKSVLIKHVIGLLKQDAGSIVIDGKNTSTMSPIEWNTFRRRFGMLFQGGALFDSMTVFENVAFPLRERRLMNERDIRKRVMELLEMVEMADWEQEKPPRLSGGMKKRVGLARALAAKPSIMLYDEPTTGLDPVVGGVIDNLIVKTRDQFKSTSITITHDIRSAYRIGHRIAMLYKGKVIKVGTPEEFRRCEIPEVKEFVRERTAGFLSSNKVDPPIERDKK